MQLPIPTKETGEEDVSINNAMLLTKPCGVIVGAIHIITPSTKNRHYTRIFYTDGSIHTCTGFEIGSKNEKTNGFKWLVQQIPGVACHVEGDFLARLSNDPETKKTLKKEKEIHFIFRAPDLDRKNCSFLNECNDGVDAMNQTISEIAKDDYCQLVELW